MAIGHSGGRRRDSTEEADAAIARQLGVSEQAVYKNVSDGHLRDVLAAFAALLLAIGGAIELVGAGYRVVDVREPREWRAGHVPGAVHVAFWRVLFGDGPGELRKNRSSPRACGGRVAGRVQGADRGAAAFGLLR